MKSKEGIRSRKIRRATEYLKELLYRQLPNMVLQKDTPKLYNRNRAARPAVLETTFGKGRFDYYPGMYGPFNFASV